jgi:plasmid replication initiation protein
MDAINANDVLTLHRDYWRLRRPIERRLYEIVRKHCGGKAEWRISVANLHIKSGSKATRREFRRKLNEVIEDNHLPDFTVELENDVLIARPRDGLKERLSAPQKSNIGQTKLDAKAKSKAKKYAGGWALDFLETQWRAFCESQGVTVRSAEAHFIDFCKRYVEKNGRI